MFRTPLVTSFLWIPSAFPLLIASERLLFAFPLFKAKKWPINLLWCTGMSTACHTRPRFLSNTFANQPFSTWISRRTLRVKACGFKKQRRNTFHVLFFVLIQVSSILKFGFRTDVYFKNEVNDLTWDNTKIDTIRKTLRLLWSSNSVVQFMPCLKSSQ